MGKQIKKNARKTYILTTWANLEKGECFIYLNFDGIKALLLLRLYAVRSTFKCPLIFIDSFVHLQYNWMLIKVSQCNWNNYRLSFGFKCSTTEQFQLNAIKFSVYIGYISWHYPFYGFTVGEKNPI